MSDLSGISVLVTRPEHQAEAFCALLEEAGGKAVRFPVVEIADVEDSRPLLEKIDRLQDFDWAVFVSPNAASKAANSIEARRSWPEHLKIAAIGRKTGQELKRLGHPADVCPRKGFNSEALLDEPDMQDLSGQRVIIFRGGAGREVLGDTLKQRGADIEYAEAYRRTKPAADKDAILRHWSRGEIDVITITSVEGLRNLFDMVGKLGQFWLRNTALVVGSERMVETVTALGFKQPPVVADDPSDEAMLAALITWQQQREQS